MITHALNAEEVSNLIREHLCDDLTTINADNNIAIVRSDKDKFVGQIVAFPVSDGTITIVKDDGFNQMTELATELDYSTLFIAVTSEGVFQFNLSLLRLDFETYADHSAGFEVSVAQADVSNGVQILEWYPEFASEDEYIDALMSNGDSIGFDETDTW